MAGLIASALCLACTYSIVNLPTRQQSFRKIFDILTDLFAVKNLPAIRTDGVGVACCRQADVVVWASHHARP